MYNIITINIAVFYLNVFLKCNLIIRWQSWIFSSQYSSFQWHNYKCWVV